MVFPRTGIPVPCSLAPPRTLSTSPPHLLSLVNCCSFFSPVGEICLNSCLCPCGSRSAHSPSMVVLSFRVGHSGCLLCAGTESLWKFEFKDYFGANHFETHAFPGCLKSSSKMHIKKKLARISRFFVPKSFNSSLL